MSSLAFALEIREWQSMSVKFGMKSTDLSVDLKSTGLVTAGLGCPVAESPVRFPVGIVWELFAAIVREHCSH